MFFLSGTLKKSHVKFLGFVFALKFNKTTRALIVILLNIIINWVINLLYEQYIDFIKLIEVVDDKSYFKMA